MIPNSTIKLCRSVPIDNTYRNTIYTTSKAEQFQYFDTGYVYLEFTANTYVRVENNVIRVQVNLSQNPTVYNCNYLLFKNTSYENKWFYAFITEVLYVNDNTVQIRYELDVIQTWIHDITFRQCFIKRQHVEDDSIGANIEPEPVDLSEYKFASKTDGTEYKAMFNNGLAPLCIVVATVDAQDIPDGADTALAGDLFDGIYSGATLRAYNTSNEGLEALNAFVQKLIQKPDAIICMYMCPVLLIEQVIPDDGLIISRKRAPYSYTSMLTAVNTSMSLDGHKPRNHKLYTYPYNFLHIDNSNGATLTLRYEFFGNNTPRLQLKGCLTQPVQAMIKPVDYKNAPTADGLMQLNNEVLTIGNYPLCSWNTDAWKAWIAQNFEVTWLKATAGATAGGLAGAMAGGVGALPGALIGGGMALVHDAQNWYKASIQADQIHGNFNNGSVNSASGQNNFYAGRMCIAGECARDIDNFFDMYGYAINKVDVPHRHVRNTYTYIQTENCLVVGNAPADAIGKIEKIMDRGITWWVAGSTVGDYSQSNSPINNGSGT